MNMDKFKADHVAVLSSISDLRNLVHAGIAENSDSIAKAVVGMSAAIKTHLAAEDKMLYPTLAKSSDPEVVRLGKTFQDEMGSIADAYVAFSRKWNLGRSIAANPALFRSDANDIFKALFQRIQRENQHLYPVADHV